MSAGAAEAAAPMACCRDRDDSCFEFKGLLCNLVYMYTRHIYIYEAYSS